MDKTFTEIISPEVAGVLPKKWEGRASFTVDETAEIFEISRAHAYAVVAKGDIGSVRIGRSIRIPRAEVVRAQTVSR